MLTLIFREKDRLILTKWVNIRVSFDINASFESQKNVEGNEIRFFTGTNEKLSLSGKLILSWDDRFQSNQQSNLKTLVSIMKKGNHVRILKGKRSLPIRQKDKEYISPLKEKIKERLTPITYKGEMGFPSEEEKSEASLIEPGLYHVLSVSESAPLTSGDLIRDIKLDLRRCQNERLCFSS